MSFTASDQIKWELKSEPGQIFTTAELKARAPFRRKSIHGMEVRIAGTGWWRGLTDIEELKPRRLGALRRFFQIMLRGGMWLSLSLGVFLWAILTLGYLSHPFDDYINEEPFDLSPFAGEGSKVVALIVSVVFIPGFGFGVISRLLTHPWIPLSRAIWVEFRTFFAAYAFGVSMVFFPISIVIVVKWAGLMSESPVGGGGMWLDCLITTAAGLLFLSFARAAFFSPIEATTRPSWLKETGANVRIAIGRSQYLSRILLSILPVFSFFMIPAALQVAKGIGIADNPVYLALWVIGIGLLGVLGWIQLKGLSFRLSGPSPFTVLQSDPRPPVLFLRNFQNDIGFMGKTGEVSDEQDWSEAFDSMVGPPIAVGRPGEWLSSLGAPRIYVANDEENSWQKVIEALIHESAAVIFPADLNPELKKPPRGLTWELDQALKADHRKVFFVVGRNRYPEGYDHFRRSMEETLLKTGQVHSGLPESPDPGSIIAIQNGIPTILRGKFGWGTLFLASLGGWQRSAILVEQILSNIGIKGYGFPGKQSLHTYSDVKVILPVIIAFLFLMLIYELGGRFMGVWILGLGAIWYSVSRLKSSVDRYGEPLKIMMVALQKPDRPPPASWSRHEFLRIAKVWIVVGGVVMAGLAHGACKLIEFYIMSR